VKPRICQSKKKDGNPCKGNALGGGYFCYVHQNSKDPILTRDPLLEATREWHNSIVALIDWHYRTGGDVSEIFGRYVPPPEKNPYRKQTNLNKRYTPPVRNR
jgi:hypothetical protein